MSVNKFLPHVLVLPEDDANLKLAKGFLLDVQLNQRKIQVLPEAGGWTKVVDCFKETHVPELNRHSNRHMILLIDFDQQQDRLQKVTENIPTDLHDRVYVLGVWSEPEELRKDLGDFEKIGSTLASECREATGTTWNHELLKHNACELDRLRKQVRPFLFS